MLPWKKIWNKIILCWFFSQKSSRRPRNCDLQEESIQQQEKCIHCRSRVPLTPGTETWPAWSRNKDRHWPGSKIAKFDWKEDLSSTFEKTRRRSTKGFSCNLWMSKTIKMAKSKYRCQEGEGVCNTLSIYSSFFNILSIHSFVCSIQKRNWLQFKWPDQMFLQQSLLKKF